MVEAEDLKPDPVLCRVLPCAMEVSPPSGINGLQGGGGHPPPSPLPHPPSVNGNSDLVVNKKIVSSSGDHHMEDRGVDLSFDSVKKEQDSDSEQNTFSARGPVKVKQEFNDGVKQERETQSPSSLQSPGGRLKIFRNGELLLELRGDGERGKWVSAQVGKVFWPPGPPAAAPHTARLDSGASQHTNTGSEGSVETSSLHSQTSPWHQSLPSPRPSPSNPSDASQSNSVRHRVKPVPKKLVNPPQELLFAMKPPQGVKNYRKKIRPFRRKCRNPESEIKIGLFMLRLECNAAGTKVKKFRRSRLDPKVRAARLADLVSKLTSLRNRVHVPIQAWKTGRTDLTNLVKGPPSPHVPAPGAIRVKSELKLVTETCTATITSVTSSPKIANKVKAETRTVTAETRPVPVKSLPITPTIGRVKQELTGDRGFKLSATAIMSPELARVKMEIGRDNHNYMMGRDDRDGAFVSPRKRLMQRDFDNGSPSAKHRRMSSEHRLSTDSLGSTSDRSSPYRAPHSPHRSAMSPAPGLGPLGPMSPKPKVSFSIDSIMGGGAGPTMPSRPVLTPSKHPPLSHLRTPSMPLQPTPTRPRPPSSPPRSPPPSREPPTPYSPYSMFPGVNPLLVNQEPRLLDPRLAQLAGLAGAQLAAADPRVNQLAAAAADPRLAPGSPYHNLLLNQYMAAAVQAQAQAAASASPLSGLFAANSLAASQAAAVSQAAAAAAASQNTVWTPPVATTALTTPSPTPPPIPPPKQFAGGSPAPASPSLPPPSSRPSDFLRHPPAAVATSKAPDITYRGDPSRCSKLFGDTDDAPLNLSMKPTTL